MQFLVKVLYKGINTYNNNNTCNVLILKIVPSCYFAELRVLDDGTHSTNRRCECDPTKGYYDPSREDLEDDASYSAEMPCTYKWPPCEQGEELDVYGMA